MINREDNPDYLNSFLDYTITILNKSPNSVKEYNYDLSMFLRFIKIHFNMTKEDDFSQITYNDIDIKTIKKIELNDIHAFLSYLATVKHAKATTRARKASTIRIFFSYLSEQHLIEKNPAQNLKNPKLDKRQPKYLNLEDSQKLLQVAENPDNRNNLRDYAILTIFLNCGLRLSELVGINIPDIDFKEYKMTVIGKGNKERTLFLNKACVRAIKDYMNEERPKEGIKADKLNSKDALFLSERKTRISRRTVQNIVEKELKNAGLSSKNLSTHKLRHTAATLMYQYGKVDIRALQEVLGHESISTTEIYTHVVNEQVRNAIESNPLADI